MEENGLRKRLNEEPGYRPHCLACRTMSRMTPVIENGRVVKFWCDPTFQEPAIEIGGMSLPGRLGCGIIYVIDGNDEPSYTRDRPAGAAKSVYHQTEADEKVTPVPQGT